MPKASSQLSLRRRVRLVVGASTQIALEGLRTTIDAVVDGDLVASAPFTVYPLDRLPGLRLQFIRSWVR